MGLHPSLGGKQVPDIVSGRTARHIFAQADVNVTRQTGTDWGGSLHVSSPHVMGVTQGYGENRGYPHGEVWTSQGHLHLPTIKKYATEGPPEHDMEYADEEGHSDVPYHPETYHYGGKEWIAEGHHRIVSSRLAR